MRICIDECVVQFSEITVLTQALEKPKMYTPSTNMLQQTLGHLYILVATDYFLKWAEAVPLREVKKEMVVNFIQTHLIYWYCV